LFSAAASTIASSAWGYIIGEIDYSPAFFIAAAMLAVSLVIGNLIVSRSKKLPRSAD